MRHYHHTFLYFLATVFFSSLETFRMVLWSLFLLSTTHGPLWTKFLLPVHLLLCIWVTFFCFLVCLIYYCWKLDISDNITAALGTDFPFSGPELIEFVFVCSFAQWRGQTRSGKSVPAAVCYLTFLHTRFPTFLSKAKAKECASAPLTT